ncbi:nitrilase-related carbon-nitrogen hydrolase [Roseibium sp.]|uniref:nitrilase-related carbon-nitrogen hydrolase n=1 Tax=Roseibium sp. TaxID=1936156 RepID=UPI003A974F5E
MSEYPIALCALNLGFAPRSVADLASHVEERLARARDEGARLLMLPEYAIEACLAFKPDGLKPTEEIAFMAKAGAQLVEATRGLAEKYGVSLLLGSMPTQTDRGFANTAILQCADGREIRQDKLSLTPGEMDAESWTLKGGDQLGIFELDGLRMAILICLDVEMPSLSCLLAKEKIDLLLVPSMTEMLSGYHRVFDCAKARAVELMTCVAVCGTVGATTGTTQMETNVSGAALFVPCEEELGFTGVAASIAATDGAMGEEPFLVVPVPVDVARKLRAGGAEVWPGAWSADHVTVVR